ncbi:MAG: V-type ATP synthase subunit D [Gemmatimonadota bacterium]
MARVRLTKNELKKQKDDLARFTRFLPTLELKKQQLIAEVHRVQAEVAEIERQIEATETDVARWVSVFAEPVEWDGVLKVQQVRTSTDNVAGIDIPIFDGVDFEDLTISPFETPLWLDRGREAVMEQIRRHAEISVLRRQEEILQDELRITVQRIKLFEEIKIPQAKEAIRIIRIFLGDQLTAEIVRGKISKAKIDAKRREAAAS